MQRVFLELVGFLSSALMADWWLQITTFIMAGRAPPRFPPVTEPRQPGDPTALDVHLSVQCSQDFGLCSGTPPSPERPSSQQRGQER